MAEEINIGAAVNPKEELEIDIKAIKEVSKDSKEIKIGVPENPKTV